MPDAVRAAAVQMDVFLGENDRNLERALARLAEAARNGARLIVFPEACLSGYCFGSLAEAEPFLDEAEGPRLSAFRERCWELDVVGVLGFLESEGVAAYNSATIAYRRAGGSAGVVYRKSHLPTLGVDRFVSRGDGFSVVDTPALKLGTLVCYDIRFCEAARCLALDGAEAIALPTNWPQGAESSPDFLTTARAWESRVWIVAADRTGVERGRSFIGRSQIVAPSGQIVQEAGLEETILYHDLDLAQSRSKRIVNEPGEWELDITGDRRPELYQRLMRR
jgi:predicted amidohydrolase